MSDILCHQLQRLESVFPGKKKHLTRVTQYERGYKSFNEYHRALSTHLLPSTPYHKLTISFRNAVLNGSSVSTAKKNVVGAGQSHLLDAALGGTCSVFNISPPSPCRLDDKESRYYITRASKSIEHLKMANLIRHVVSNYNEILENNRDPMVDTWLLMQSPGPIFCIVGAYLVFVLKIGPKMMEKRPAFQLNGLMIAYNGFQVLFSIWLCSLVWNLDIRSVIISSGCSFQMRENMMSSQAAISKGGWWYFFSKVIELLDTVFFVLRKKQNQVSFLHVYHHTITVIFSWCYLKLLPGEQGVVVGFLNAFVHVVMYTYYLIAALGPKYRKYLWWKKYMTWIQLIQFVIMLCYLLSTLAMDCKMPKALTYFFLTNVVIFIYLFSDFYRKAYKTKKA
ncbi:hypothetical protein KM043_017659 [Ampulex compressa]|nr:hypothetical protein KM043_017659 [Ampulex compressa]